MHRAADRLDRDVLAGLRPTRFLHRSEDLTMARDRGAELAFGLRPAIPRALRCVDARGHRVAAVAGSGSVTSEAKLPPSFVQRSASSNRVTAPPTITRSVVRGLASVAHAVPQRQQLSSWRAIGARQ
jgi:hypothetical protein